MIGILGGSKRNGKTRSCPRGTLALTASLPGIRDEKKVVSPATLNDIRA